MIKLCKLLKRLNNETVMTTITALITPTLNALGNDCHCHVLVRVLENKVAGKLI